MSEKNSVKEIVFKAIEPTVQKLCVELIDVSFSKKSNEMVLSIFIDKKGGISLDDCEKIHLAVDPIIEKLDPTKGKHFVMEVSSLGADRPLLTDKDFALNVGEDVEIKLFASIEKKKIFVGKLVGFDDNSVFVVVENKQKEFERKSISKITKFISF